MLQWYPVCSFCGSSSVQWSKTYFDCLDCHKRNFVNASTAAWCYLYDDQWHILLVQVAREPRKGKYKDAWWFADVDQDRSLEGTVQREVKEELSIDIDKTQLHYLCSRSERYRYQERDVPVMVALFVYHLPEEQKAMMVCNDDVAGYLRVSPDTFDPSIMATLQHADAVRKAFDFVKKVLS